jgi:hypothetical protein
MSKTIAVWAALAAAAMLAGCASDGRAPADVWAGGDPAHLSADQTACRAEAADLDVNQAANYSDARYGVASAMAEAVSKDNPLSDQGPAIRRAAFDTCMTDKGWKLQ